MNPELAALSEPLVRFIAEHAGAISYCSARVTADAQGGRVTLYDDSSRIIKRFTGLPTRIAVGERELVLYPGQDYWVRHDRTA